MDRCLATARRFGVIRPSIVQGAQNVVLVAGERALRFPRRSADAARIHEVAARHRVAHECGLAPHAPVRTVAGPVGVAHVELVRIAGNPLPEVLADRGIDLDAVVESLVRALAATRRVQAPEWPFAQRDWVELWTDLPRRARDHADSFPAGTSPAWIGAAERAAEVAAVAPLGLMHGDLQGHNVLVAPGGTVTAVLDWDSALIGDPAMDSAAALYDFPTEVRDRVVARHIWLGADLERFAAYRATWELQAALWDAGSRPEAPVRPRPRAGTAR